MILLRPGTDIDIPSLPAAVFATVQRALVMKQARQYVAAGDGRSELVQAQQLDDGCRL